MRRNAEALFSAFGDGTGRSHQSDAACLEISRYEVVPGCALACVLGWLVVCRAAHVG